jgi:hypothetical protein
VLGVAVLLLAIVSAAAWYFYSSGYLLYYGDAQAHLNISRSLIDARVTGYDQLGTVWLPVLHLICLPFVARNHLWESGLAGTIPVGICFVVAGLCLYLCGKDVYGSSAAALVGMLCFALNPNVLYLATITMTEIVFVAGLALCLLAILWYRKTQHNRWTAAAIVASWWMSLTRYDGWFLIPFIGLFLMFAAKENKLRVLIVSGLMASLAPLYWMAHNWFETGNALDFYNGPYSAAAIQGEHNYPGFHDWPAAVHYYWAAGSACSGYGLIVAGVLGLIVALARGWWKALGFLALTPLFYVWSVHSSKTPVYLPSLWPHGYYNSRYGIAVVVFMAFAVGALASALPSRIRFLPLLALVPWLVRPNPQNWICWKESQVNSDSRRAWTAQAADYLANYYRSGDGVLVEFGDLAGIFGKAGIPLREALHEGSGPAWFVNTMPSGLVAQTRWAIAQKDDKLARRLQEAKSFHVVDVIAVHGAPDLFIYERN